MKKLLPLLLIFSYSAQAAEEAVIYGEDNRTPVIDSSELAKKLARSTAVMVSNDQIQKRLFSRNATISDILSFNDLVYDFEGTPLCEEERFRQEGSAGNCSGFLIGGNILVTAGHCIMTQSQCDNFSWVFDYNETQTGKIRIPKKNIYACEKVLSWKNDFISGLDYSIIQLKKHVTDRLPLDIRRVGKIEDGTPLIMISNPFGLATKVADNATVQKNDDENFFMADLDALQGSSGSAVFNAKTGVVEGILVRGEDDFEYNSERECFNSKVCEKFEDCRGEDVVRITSLPEISGGGKVHQMALDNKFDEMETFFKSMPWIDVINEEGRSPLMSVALAGNMKAVDYLLSKNASPNHQDQRGNTILHYLSKQGKLKSDIAKKLIDHGASKRIKNTRGETVMDIERMRLTMTEH